MLNNSRTQVFNLFICLYHILLFSRGFCPTRLSDKIKTLYTHNRCFTVRATKQAPIDNVLSTPKIVFDLSPYAWYTEFFSFQNCDSNCCKNGLEKKMMSLECKSRIWDENVMWEDQCSVTDPIQILEPIQIVSIIIFK